MALAMKMLGGALLGGVAGFLLGKVKTCSSEACAVRANRVYFVIAGAVFGAAVAAAMLTD